ncbi:MAG: GIY-YIG nuclease family protein, partial [Promethearchaeota archaeon]
MVEREKDPYGYIYRATNVVNGKVYIGQTVASRWNEGKIPIEERWKEEVGEAYRKEARGENLRYVENAIVKYGPENFDLTQQDIAYNQEELDRKETEHIRDYDSMNPDEGYNLKEGGLGGRLSEQAKENLSNVMKEKYQNDPEYYNKQFNERQERAKDPEFIKKMTEINREQAKNPQRSAKLSEKGTKKWQEREYNEKQSKERQERAKNNPEWVQKMAKINQEIARNPKVQEKMSRVLTEKWQETKYQESVSKGVTEKWKDEKYRERQARAKTEGKREIPDKEQFLKDIKEM